MKISVLCENISNYIAEMQFLFDEVQFHLTILTKKEEGIFYHTMLRNNIFSR